MNHRVYSYIRFSSPQQAKGDSLARQTAYARRYAEEHDLVLDETLTMRDQGLSAYHQDHIKHGAFGNFLAAVRSGQVQHGSVLIVEALDRISRAEPIEAQIILSQIIMAGITVVTVIDNKVYERERIRENPMDLMHSLVVFIRAHDESEHKSRRIRQAHARKVQQWIEHGAGPILTSGQDPRWVTPNEARTGFELVPDRVAIVRHIIDLYRKGWGVNRIVDHLNGQYPPFNGTRWYVGYLPRLLKSRTLIGERNVVHDGQDRVIKGYYPAVLSEADFYDLQKTVAGRASTKSQRQAVNLVTGMQVSHCGLCGSVLCGQNYSHRQTGGSLSDGYRRIRCGSYGQGSDCRNRQSVSVAPIERALLEYCADQMELASVLGDNDRTAQLRAQVADLYRQASEAQRSVEAGEQSIRDLLSRGETVSAVINQVIEESRVELQAIRAKLQTAEEALRFEGRHRSKDLLEEWQALKHRACELDEQARLTVRQLVKRTFKRIDVFLHGLDSSNKLLHQRIKQSLGTHDTIDLILTFPNDNTRLISIDKASGDWVNHKEVATVEKLIAQVLAVHPAATNPEPL